MINKTALSILSIPILSFTMGSLCLAAEPGVRSATVRQVAIGKRFAVRPPSAQNKAFTLVEPATGRSAPLTFGRYGVQDLLAVVKGGGLTLSGWNARKVTFGRLNQLGVRAGVHTGKYLGSVAYQLVNAKGWQRKGNTYERTALIDGKKGRLCFMVLKGDAGQRVGTLWVRGRRSVKELAADTLHTLANKLSPPHTTDIVPKATEIYSEAN